MDIISYDPDVKSGRPTVWKDNQLGQQYSRSCTWKDERAEITVTCFAFVIGVRARKEPDGAIVLTDLLRRYDTIKDGEFVQPVEKAVFIWERTKFSEDGNSIYDSAIDYSDHVAENYAPSLEVAEKQCRTFLGGLDFRRNFTPEKWN